ncbi:MAG: hypothetical protein WDZ63_08045 [Burkholderiales bacterium]
MDRFVAILSQSGDSEGKSKEQRNAKAAKKRKVREEKQRKVWRLQRISLQHRNCQREAASGHANQKT